VGCDDGGKEWMIEDFGPRWRLLGFVAQNQRDGTMGPCQTARACQVEEPTMKGRQKLGTDGPCHPGTG